MNYLKKKLEGHLNAWARTYDDFWPKPEFFFHDGYHYYTTVRDMTAGGVEIDRAEYRKALDAKFANMTTKAHKHLVACAEQHAQVLKEFDTL